MATATAMPLSVNGGDTNGWKTSVGCDVEEMEILFSMMADPLRRSRSMENNSPQVDEIYCRRCCDLCRDDERCRRRWQMVDQKSPMRVECEG
jgi:hypothetical protein